MTMNITAWEPELAPYESREDLKRFYRDLGYDGLELMLCGTPEVPEKLPREDLIGLHLRYYHSWVDFWKEDRQALLREFGEEALWQQYFGGATRQEFLDGFRMDLDTAQALGVKYVVFHIAECTLEESLTYRFVHTDEEVCDAAVEVINTLLDGKDYDFHFLVENLWWSGLTLTRPEITRRVMDGIHYPKKGILLDTGHLLHTNNDLRTQAEAVDYIGQILDRNGDLCRWIKGMHLNQSLSGAYVQEALKHPMELTGDYWQRLTQIFPHIQKIDYHQPFTDPGVAALIRRIRPEFVTVELLPKDLQQRRDWLRLQMEALEAGGGIEY